MGKSPIIISAREKWFVKNRNILAINERYVEAITKAGGFSLSVNNLPNAEELSSIEEIMDGLLLTGGDDINATCYGETCSTLANNTDNERDKIELLLLKVAIEKNIAVLGICRGLQIINIGLGGTLHQDLYSEWSQKIQHNNSEKGRDYLAHSVELDRTSKLFSIIDKDEFLVNSLHHQGIEQLSEGLIASAVAEDGLIEAVELPNHNFFIGVQWHPEELTSNNPQWLKLFEAFITAASKTSG
ncbi:MAG: gamma-glutamyl-gamma-aminobutyrate hydrolase family protein [Candidatus Vogelbacteria bacterium]|nr:gamma-glutamyl-gamma-aminobutyrate hydrolase family protein [Candidatus Vogelbacteria bacterium]